MAKENKEYGWYDATNGFFSEVAFPSKEAACDDLKTLLGSEDIDNVYIIFEIKPVMEATVVSKVDFIEI